MLTGTMTVSQVPEESTCRSSKEYRFTDIGVYKIHSTSLMANIPFEEANELPEMIDATIFLNDNDTKLNFSTTIMCQNYLTTRYVGRAPLEFYTSDQKTEMGRQFILKCPEGKPYESERYFGTEDAIRGYNRNASDTVTFSEGGE